MSYNSRHHNTRHSNRYNRPGSFIPPSSSNHHTYEVPQVQAPAPPLQPPLQPPPQMKCEPEPQPAPQPEPVLQPTTQDAIKQANIEMETESTGDESSTSNSRKSFFKSKLLGIKKISNKERRRRQNSLLRRLTTPKNALMCINEMMPNEQVTNQFKVEPTPPASAGFFSNNIHNFCAELVLDGVTYKGYGENKLAARNAAAEQAIRDIVLRKMERYSELMAQAAAADAAGEGGAEALLEAEGAEALPMIQLLSFALHKLFAEWEGAGHRVPHLRAKQPSQQTCEEERLPPKPAPAAARKPRKVPDNAASMHPAMLLTVLRPNAAYRELEAEGDRPQNMVFTFAVDVDDKTFIGKAPNKREARKQAARAACKDILNITFDDEKMTIN